jgi:hypothetical protein
LLPSVSVIASSRPILFSFLSPIRDSVVGIATGYGLDGRGVGVRVLVGSRIFSTSCRPALGSIQPRVQGTPGALSRGVKLTTHLQPVPRSRKCGSIHPLPHTPSWHSA